MKHLLHKVLPLLLAVVLSFSCVVSASAQETLDVILSATTTHSFSDEPVSDADHDAWCEKLGVDPSLQAVAVLLIGKSDVDATSSASLRSTMEEKVTFVK